ncbi:high nitrogen upregulated cytochrome P450 monooxygenase 2 [Lactarius hengduanensis]|nr:high nitrogen upregulated cytochrome P450 monooxygenase 2 [Lactarius hengduanensis]
MSPPTADLFLQLHQTLGNLSLPTLSVVVLSCSFVSHLCFRFLEPRSLSALVVLLVVLPVLLSLPISYHVRWPAIVSLPLAFVTYGTSLLSFTLAYRLSPLHPLAKYPGPVIAKSSQWWAAYLGGEGDLYRYTKNLHDRYGDIVRVGPNALSIRDPSLILTVLGKGGLPKGPYWDNRPPSVVAQRDPIKHMNQRKPWSRAFSSAAVKEYEVFAAKRTRQLLGCIEDAVHQSGEKKGVVLDMAAWFNYFTTDFMGDMAFGGGFELMKAGGDNEGIWTLIESHLRFRAITGHVSYVLPPLLAIVGRKGSIRRIHAFARDRVVKRLQMGAKRKDLFYHLSGEAMPEDERPALDDVAKDGALAIVAGSDTTSGALTATLYYLLRNPTAYDRLQAEVDAAFPTGEEPLDVTKLSQMEWLNGCINEGLRLLPPVPSGSPRSVDKGTGEKVLGKWVIPEGTQVTLHTYSIQRDPRNFHTPDAFLPERWFSAGAPAGEHNSAAFLPFSYGPANCAGKNLASMEMRMALCWVLRRFQFSKAPGFRYEEWEGKILDWFAVSQPPLLVSISIRE